MSSAMMTTKFGLAASTETNINASIVKGRQRIFFISKSVMALLGKEANQIA